MRYSGGKFIAGLKSLYRAGTLKIPEMLPDSDSVERFLTESCHSDWVVYSKAPFAGPRGGGQAPCRYTHRVAIGNSRLVSHGKGRVNFRYRDYADAGNQKVTSLTGQSFLQRFLLHVVPKGFVRIRHCGFLCHSKKRESLARIRRELLCGTLAPQPEMLNPHSASFPPDRARTPACPCCGETRWVKLGVLKPLARQVHSPPFVASPPSVS